MIDKNTISKNKINIIFSFITEPPKTIFIYSYENVVYSVTVNFSLNLANIEAKEYIMEEVKYGNSNKQLIKKDLDNILGSSNIRTTLSSLIRTYKIKNILNK